jgi:hypothetical protein
MIQGFELARFVEGQSDKHPSAAVIDEISAGKTIHSLTALSLSKDYLEA